MGYELLEASGTYAAKINPSTPPPPPPPPFRAFIYHLSVRLVVSIAFFTLLLLHGYSLGSWQHDQTHTLWQRLILRLKVWKVSIIPCKAKRLFTFPINAAPVFGSNKRVFYVGQAEKVLQALAKVIL